MTDKSIRGVVVIGGGPAGLIAATYLARASLSPLVFAGIPGESQISLTAEIENFPGFEKISGAELIEKLRNQAKKFGAEIIDEPVAKVDFSKKPFKVYLQGSIDSVGDSLPATYRTILTKSVIIATGAKPKWLGIESEEKFKGKGIGVCATCDGFFYRNKTVAVVGGGNAALEETLQLAKVAAKVYLIHRRNELRADKILQERAFKNEKIEIIWDSQIVEVLGTNKVEAIKLGSTKSEARNPKQFSNSSNSNLFRDSKLDIRTLKVDGLFIAIGRKPNTDLFKNQLELDEQGYIVINKKLRSMGKFFNSQSETSIEGIFAAGDCITPDYRQAGVAAGSGIVAALDVEKYLEN